MKISCFCGHHFEAKLDAAVCPICGTLAIAPRLSEKDAQEMEADLREILADHEG